MPTADTDRPPALNVRDTTNCPAATLCELCHDADRDLSVVVWVNGGLGACVTCCPSCAAEPIPTDAALSMYARALDHAAHLGTPADLLTAVGTIRAGGQLTDTATVPVGPFEHPPSVLAWLLSGGYARPADEIDPAHITRWLTHALEESDVAIGTGELAALSDVAALGPEVAQVVAGWVRRSRGTRTTATPASFDPATATHRATQRRVQLEEQAARLRDEPDPVSTRAVPTFTPTEQPDPIAEQLADEAAADMARRIARITDR